MTITKLFFLVVLIMNGANSMAQQSLNLSLDSAVTLSVRESKKLKTDSLGINIAEAKFLQAQSEQLPSARVAARYTHLSDNVDPFILQIPGTGGAKLEIPQLVNRFTPTLSANQLLYAGGQVKYAKRSAKMAADAARHDFEQSKTDLINQTIKAYFDLYKLQQTKRLVLQNRLQVQEHLKEIQDYQKNGLVLKNDVLRIELQLRQLDHSLIELNSALEVANFNLSILLGLPVATYAFQLNDEDLNRPIEIKNEGDYLESALNRREDLQAVKDRMGIAVMNLQISKAHYYPKVSAGANYYYHNPNERVFPARPNFKGTWDVGVTLSWDVHALYRNSHKVEESKALVTQTQVQKDQLQDEIKTQVNEKYQAFIQCREKIKVSELGVKQAQENYRIVQKRFLNNTILTSELSDADSLLLQAQITLLVDRADVYETYYKLLHASGQLNLFYHQSNSK